MSVEISSDILAVTEKMSMEISSDILTVKEKCLWKFPAPDISTVPINVGEVSSEEKWRWKFPATFWL